MNFKIFALVLAFPLLIISCKKASEKETKEVSVNEQTPVTFQNKGHELVYNMAEKVGNYQKLRSKKDVVYTYTYTTPDDLTDVSTEKYIFEGELSYGEYKQHHRTLPQLEGTMEQGFDGKEYWLKANGNLVIDSIAIKRIMFTRPTNFYWFTMFQKLLDPGLKYDYLGEKQIENNKFDIVKVTFESKSDKPTDIYQLYINKSTGLVDQFLFTVADHGVLEEPLLMQVEYENIEGFLLPTKRKYKKSTWNAEINDAPWILVNWSNIKFDINLKKSAFLK